MDLWTKGPPEGLGDAAAGLASDFQGLHDFVETFQKGHTERVTNLILQYLP